MGTRNSSASRLYIHRVGQQSPLGFSGSAKSSLENIQAISTPRRDTEQKDHTGYHQPSRFWLRDGRRVSQDVERELALTGCDIPIKSFELGLADALHHARARGLHSLSLGQWMIARLAVQIPMWPQPLLATRNLSASRLYSSGVAR